MDPGHASLATIRQSETCAAILDIIFEYSLHKFDDTMSQLEAGRPRFLSVIQRFVAADTKVDMCLPAFPFKSANKQYKVFGLLPDKAEELALARLESICQRIDAIYPPGAMITIISDGLVYNDLLSVSDRDTWAYGEDLRSMATKKGFCRLTFSRIKDLVDFPSPDKLNEITYVASATNFRRCLLNQYGDDNIDIEREISTNNDTMATYLGYRRFLVSDLKYIFPLGEARSKTAYKRDVKYLAQQMLIRGYAFAGAVKSAYPNHLRLSIHQSTGEHKISLSLLNTKTGFTTPWHCSVALMANDEWLSAPKGDFEQDTGMRVVQEHGRPSYFIQDSTTLGPNQEGQPKPVASASAESLPEEKKRYHDLATEASGGKSSGVIETSQSNLSEGNSQLKEEQASPGRSQPQAKGGLRRWIFSRIFCV